MSYKRAEKVLPVDLLKLIQEYVDGEYLYIPRKPDRKRCWGTNTDTRHEIKIRNRQIYLDYLNETPINELADKYFLSVKSIQRILLQTKRNVI